MTSLSQTQFPISREDKTPAAARARTPLCPAPSDKKRMKGKIAKVATATHLLRLPWASPHPRTHFSGAFEGSLRPAPSASVGVWVWVGRSWAFPAAQEVQLWGSWVFNWAPKRRALPARRARGTRGGRGPQPHRDSHGRAAARRVGAGAGARGGRGEPRGQAGCTQRLLPHPTPPPGCAHPVARRETLLRTSWNTEPRSRDGCSQVEPAYREVRPSSERTVRGAVSKPRRKPL